MSRLPDEATWSLPCGLRQEQTARPGMGRESVGDREHVAQDALGEALFAMGLRSTSPNRGVLGWLWDESAAEPCCLCDSCFLPSDVGCFGQTKGVQVCTKHRGLDPRRERPGGRVSHTDFGIEVTERESTLLPLGKRVVRKLRAEGYADVEMEYAWLPLSEVVYGRQVSDWNVQGRVSIAAQELGL